MDATPELAATDERARTDSPATDAADSDMAPADETTGMEATDPPARPERDAPVEVGQAHPGEVMGEPLSEDPVTHELVPPEQQVRAPDA